LATVKGFESGWLWASILKIIDSSGQGTRLTWAPVSLVPRPSETASFEIVENNDERKQAKHGWITCYPTYNYHPMHKCWKGKPISADPRPPFFAAGPRISFLFTFLSLLFLFLSHRHSFFYKSDKKNIANVWFLVNQLAFLSPEESKFWTELAAVSFPLIFDYMASH